MLLYLFLGVHWNRRLKVEIDAAGLFVVASNGCHTSLVQGFNAKSWWSCSSLVKWKGVETR